MKHCPYCREVNKDGNDICQFCSRPMRRPLSTVWVITIIVLLVALAIGGSVLYVNLDAKKAVTKLQTTAELVKTSVYEDQKDREVYLRYKEILISLCLEINELVRFYLSPSIFHDAQKNISNINYELRDLKQILLVKTMGIEFERFASMTQQLVLLVDDGLSVTEYEGEWVQLNFDNADLKVLVAQEEAHRARLQQTARELEAKFDPDHEEYLALIQESKKVIAGHKKQITGNHRKMEALKVSIKNSLIEVVRRISRLETILDNFNINFKSVFPTLTRQKESVESLGIVSSASDPLNLETYEKEYQWKPYESIFKGFDLATVRKIVGHNIALEKLKQQLIQKTESDSASEEIKKNIEDHENQLQELGYYAESDLLSAEIQETIEDEESQLQELGYY